MLAELRDDNKDLVARLRSVHDVAEEHNDVATTSLIEVWIDETERRLWFLFEIEPQRRSGDGALSGVYKMAEVFSATAARMSAFPDWPPPRSIIAKQGAIAWGDPSSQGGRRRGARAGGGRRLSLSLAGSR